MTIYLDTCVLPRVGPIRTALISTLLKVAEKKSDRVRIASIVLEESISARAREAGEAFSKLLSAYKAASKYYELEPLYVPSSEDVGASWRGDLVDCFEIVDVAHEDANEALVREANRTRPARNGTGARDSAIWLTAKRDHLNGGGPTHFVSSNRKDFSDEKTGQLHPDLRLELGDQADGFHFHESLNELLEAVAERTVIIIDKEQAVELVNRVQGEIDGHVPELAEFSASEFSLEIETAQGVKTGDIPAYIVADSTLVFIHINSKVRKTAIEASETVIELDLLLKMWVEFDKEKGLVRAVDLESVDVVDK